MLNNEDKVDKEDANSNQIKITGVHFKYLKNGERLWNTEECRNYLYHLGLKPIKRCKRENGIYKYIVAEGDGKKILLDDNQITIYYI